MSEDPAASNLLGAFIRAQRQMANLSLRELSAMTDVSNPYLSQIERGLFEPSARVLMSIAKALNLSAEALFAQAGLITESTPANDDATEPRFERTPGSPSRRSGHCSPSTAAIWRRTVMTYRATQMPEFAQ